MKKYVSVLLSIIILISLTACQRNYENSNNSIKSPDQAASQIEEAADVTNIEGLLNPLINPYHGSAVTLEGKVLLISIFTNDSLTEWDYTSDVDRKIISDSLANLEIATDYLSQQVKRFGKQASFVYDWETEKDLVYYADFDSELVRFDGSKYFEQNRWLVDNIDASYLLRKYDADNIIFIFFFNTDYSNQVNPWSLGHGDGDYITWEFSNFYLKYDNCDMPPSSYAHEIMHAFGAHDLYYANEYISQKYVDYLSDTASNDVMFTVSMSSEITEEFSKLDAYYVGIAPRPEVADRWSLERSEHDLN